jgi:hypothetical protein
MQEPLVSRFFKEKEALHCLLLAVGEMVWLIPSVMGAEVVSKSAESTPSYHWRGLELPLLAGTDLIKGEGTPFSYERIIILQSVQQETKIPFWGLLLNQLPQIVSLTHRDISVVPETTVPPYIQAAIHLEGCEELIYLPNFLEIECFLCEYGVLA